MEKKRGKNSYGLDPEDDTEATPPPEEVPEAGGEPPESESGFTAAATGPYVKTLDVCPNCGANLPSSDSLVCLRCGFNLKTLKVMATDTGEAAAEPAEKEKAPPLCRMGMGDLWLPSGVAIGSLLVLSVGYLAGWSGLLGEEPVNMGVRGIGLLMMLIRTAVLATAGLGALFTLANILSVRFGDLKLAVARMFGIVAAMSLATIFGAGAPALEWTLEILLQSAAFVGLAMAFFRMSVRDAATLLGVMIVAVACLLVVSALVMWSVLP